MRRSIFRPHTSGLSPLFVRVVRALAHEANADRDSAPRGHASALAALGHLVTLTMPARGVLRLTDDLREDIDRIARKHLQRKNAEGEYRDALDAISDIEKRAAIDAAHLQLIDLSERAYYYAGLASGIVFGDGFENRQPKAES